MTQTPNKAPPPIAPNDLTPAQITAMATLLPEANGAHVVADYGKAFGAQDIGELGLELQKAIRQVKVGNLSCAEAMLVSQAHSLQAIFTCLAQQAARQTAIGPRDSTLRLALKAQAQCRATLESLAELKNPRPLAFVQQANIAHGPQQVNNGEPALSHARTNAGKTINQSNELLEADHDKCLDTGTTGKATCFDPAMASVGEINRPQNE